MKMQDVTQVSSLANDWNAKGTEGDVVSNEADKLIIFLCDHLTSKLKNLTSITVAKIVNSNLETEVVFRVGVDQNEIFWIEPSILNKIKFDRKAIQRTQYDPMSGTPVMQILVPIELQSSFQGILSIDCELNNETDGIAIIREIEHAVQSINSHIIDDQKSQQKVEALTPAITRTLLSVIYAKDTYTAGHSERVAFYSNILGKGLGLSNQELSDLTVSALIHDIGKTGIPDDILKKPGSLNHEEYEIMMQHPLMGKDILRHLDISSDIMAGVQLHHEKWDGSGYPFGLSGEDIPLFARIIAVADAIDAMTSGRTYSGFVDIDTAVLQLMEKSDLFDPYILKVLYRCLEQGLIQSNRETNIRAY